MSNHGANVFFKKINDGLVAGSPIPPLSEVDAIQLADILRIDARKYYQAGLITYMDAIGGVSCNTWSWAAVKLYYSVFYLVRALLAIEGIAFVSVGKRTYWIKVKPGESLRNFPENRFISSDTTVKKKRLSGSHGSVLYLLEHNFPSSKLISQDIDGLYPTEWLMRERERHNYQSCGFPDPTPSISFQKVSDENMAKMLNAYYTDDKNLYTFSPEHAIVAYPTFVIKHVANRFEDDEKEDDLLSPPKDFVMGLVRNNINSFDFLREIVF